MTALFTAPIEEEPVAGAWAPGDPIEGPGSIPFHPLANLFPMISGSEFDELVEDIRAHGILEPIVIYTDKAGVSSIIDGRNRYMAALAAGVIYPQLPPDFRRITANGGFRRFGTEPGEDDDTDLVTWVLSKNLRRRHLSESQRAMIAAKLANMGVGRPSSLAQHGNTHVGASASDSEGGSAAVFGDASVPANAPEGGLGQKEKPANLPDITQPDAAKALHVSERSLRDAKTVQASGAPELAEAVERGDAAVSAAAAIARLPVERQAEILAEVRQSTNGKKAFAKVAKQARAETQATKKNARAVREEILGRRVAALPDKKFVAIVADPEWRFEPYSRESGMDRSADNHYPTSSLEEIKARPVATIAADDCALFLWATPPMLPQALEVMAAWGFTYRSHVIWRKIRPGNARGTGYWFHNEHELFLVGTRGNIPAPAPGDQWPSVVDAEVGAHSAKPEIFGELVEDYYPTAPKIELNRRGPPRPGWAAWGNQAEDAAAPAKAWTLDEVLREAEKAVDSSALFDAADPAVAEAIERGFIKLSKGGRARLLKAGKAHLHPVLSPYEQETLAVERRAAAFLETTGADLDALAMHYRTAIEDLDLAITSAAGRVVVGSIDERMDAILVAAAGGARFGYRVDERAASIIRRCAATDGDTPLWGQRGRFAVNVDDVEALVVFDGDGFSLHATRFNEPFPSETGFHSVGTIPWNHAGIPVAQAAAEAVRASIAYSHDKRAGSGGRGFAYPNRVYRLPDQPNTQLMCVERGRLLDQAKLPAGYDWPQICALFEAWRADSTARVSGEKRGKSTYPKNRHGNERMLAIDRETGDLTPLADFPVEGTYVIEVYYGRDHRRLRLVEDGTNPAGDAQADEQDHDYAEAKEAP